MRRFLLCALLVLGLLPLASGANVIVPNGIGNYIAIKFTNNQAQGTPHSFQINLTYAAGKNKAILSSMLNNTEFFYQNGTIVKSWMEGNVLNEQQQTNLYTSNTVLFWLNLAPSIAGSGGTQTVYLGIGKTTAQLINGANTGEAPYLTSTYANYDNGNGVFLLYYNGTAWYDFNYGNCYNLGPSTATYGIYTIPVIQASDSYPGDCSTSFGLSSTGTVSGPENVTVESSFYNASTYLGDIGAIGLQDIIGGVDDVVSVDTGYYGTGINSGFSQGSYSEYYGFLTGINPVGSDISGTWQYATATDNIGGSIWTGFITPKPYNPAAGSGVQTDYYSNPIQYGYPLAISTLVNDSQGPVQINFNWLRMRNEPPNNIMPPSTFGSLISTMNVLVTPITSSISQGNSQTLGTTVTGGTSTYSYQWFEKPPSGGFAAIGGATSSTYSFITSGATATGTYQFYANVLDSSVPANQLVESNTANIVVTAAVSTTIYLTCNAPSNAFVPGNNIVYVNNDIANDMLLFTTALSPGTTNVLVNNTVQYSMVANAAGGAFAEPKWNFSYSYQTTPNVILKCVPGLVPIGTLAAIIRPPSPLDQPVNILFIGTIIIAVIFTVALMYLLPTDYKKYPNRPLYFMLLAIGAWAMTMPLFISTNIQTTSLPGYTVSYNGNTIAQFPSFNVISYLNKPFPVSTFLTYLTFWSSVMLVLFVVLIFYLIYWLKENAKKGVENSDIGNTTKRKL